MGYGPICCELGGGKQNRDMSFFAFLEIFESGCAPHVGDVERLSGKRAVKLYVTLPNNYADWLFNYDIEFYEDDNIIKLKWSRKLRCCKIHGNKNKINVIINLKKEDKKSNHSSIHFVSKEALDIAKPFLKKYGKISHYCCSNTGVMYRTEQNSLFENYNYKF